MARSGFEDALAHHEWATLRIIESFSGQMLTFEPNVIRQLHGRRDGLADVLIDLEVDDVLRYRVIDALQRSLS